MAFYYYTSEKIKEIDPEAIPESFYDYFNDLSDEMKMEIQDYYPELYKRVVEAIQDGIDEDDPELSSDEEKILDKWESINIKEWHKDYVYTEVLVCKIVPDGTRWCRVHKRAFVEKYIKYSKNGSLYGHLGYLCPFCMTLYIEQGMIGDIIHNLDERNYAMLIQPLEDTMKEWEENYKPTILKDSTVIYIPDIWMNEDMKCPEDGGNLRADSYKRTYKDREIQFGAYYCEKCKKIEMRSSSAQQLNIDCNRIGIPEFEIKRIKPPVKIVEKWNNKFKPDYFLQNGERTVYNYDNNKYDEISEDTIFVVSYSRVCNIEDHDTEDMLVLIRVREKKGSIKRYLVLVGYCDDCKKYYMAREDYEIMYSAGRPNITVYDDTNSNYYIQSGPVFEEEKNCLQKVENFIDRKIESIRDEDKGFVGKYAVIRGGGSKDDFQNLASGKNDSIELQKIINEIAAHRDNPYGYRVELINNGITKTFYLGASEFEADGFKIDTFNTTLGGEMVNYRNTEVIFGGIKYQVKRRRQFDIIKAVLFGYMEQSDEDIIFREGLTDPFLVKVLNTRKKQHQLVDIMFTIQENQNAIVDVQPGANIIVQGCAGSGKTVVMLQRLAAIKNRYPDFDFKNVVVLTPGENFNTHINGLASSLQIGYVDRFSVERYYEYLLEKYNKDFKLKYDISDEMNVNQEYVDYIYSDDFLWDFLRAYDDYIEQMEIQSDEAVRYSKLIFDELTINTLIKESTSKAVLFLKIVDAINDKISSIISDNSLNREQAYERLSIQNVDDWNHYVEFLNRINGYNIKSVYNAIFDVASTSADETLFKRTGKRYSSGIRGTHRYDLYMQLRFAKKFYGYNVGDNSLICIDEGQDLCLNEYILIQQINGYKAIFNVYGDTNQLIKKNRGIGNWSLLNKCVYEPQKFVLNENFRNTNQITGFCNDTFNMNVIQTGVDGRNVREIIRSKLESSLSEMEILEERIAVLLPREIKRKKGYIDLDQLSVSVREITGDRIGSGRICVAYVDEVKGVEFDKVFVVTAGLTRNEKYIAYTRALSELVLVIDEELEEKIKEREEKKKKELKKPDGNIDNQDIEKQNSFVKNNINYAKIKRNDKKAIEYEESKVAYSYVCQRCKKTIEMTKKVFDKYMSEGKELPKTCQACRKQMVEIVDAGACKICRKQIKVKRGLLEQYKREGKTIQYCSDCIKSGRIHDGNRVVLTRQCIICSKPFDITFNDSKYYKSKGWSLPTRCVNCRRRKREL